MRWKHTAAPWAFATLGLNLNTLSANAGLQFLVKQLVSDGS